MKKILTLIMSLALMTSFVNAQTATNFVKGSINIKYNTKTDVDSSGKPNKGVKDIYTLNVNVCNSAIFRGTIKDTPLLKTSFMGMNESVAQPRSLSYDLICDIMNPKNPAQVKLNVGKILGNVPIAEDGTYDYHSGSLNVSILPMGQAAGFDSKFDGFASGKPLVRPVNWLDNLKREAINITKQVNGKKMTIVLKKYDKFELKNVIIGAGPVQVYQKVTANGLMLYDYEKNAWFFKDITVSYTVDNKKVEDAVTGTIIWSEERSTYDFDIRVNEPVASESAAFSGPQDESAFFQTDTSIPGLTGTMVYKDTKHNGETLASDVDINLTGNNINKQQTMVLGKIIIFLAVVPMNSD